MIVLLALLALQTTADQKCFDLSKGTGLSSVFLRFSAKNRRALQSRLWLTTKIETTICSGLTLEWLKQNRLPRRREIQIKSSVLKHLPRGSILTNGAITDRIEIDACQEHG